MVSAVPRRLRSPLLCCAALLIGASAYGAELKVAASLEAKKVPLGEKVGLAVQLTNDSDIDIGPVNIVAVPRSLATVPSTGSFTIPARAVVQHELEIQPKRLGIFNIGLGVEVGGRPFPRIAAGTLEVIEVPSAFGGYRDIVPLVAALMALGGTLVTLIVTVRKQKEILAETRRQKASDAVAQLVLQVARDYYGTISGATRGLAVAARRLHAEDIADEREHLLARVFFQREHAS